MTACPTWTGDSVAVYFTAFPPFLAYWEGAGQKQQSGPDEHESEHSDRAFQKWNPVALDSADGSYHSQEGKHRKNRRRVPYGQANSSSFSPGGL